MSLACDRSTWSSLPPKMNTSPPWQELWLDGLEHCLPLSRVSEDTYRPGADLPTVKVTNTSTVAFQQRVVFKHILVLYRSSYLRKRNRRRRKETTPPQTRRTHYSVTEHDSTRLITSPNRSSWLHGRMRGQRPFNGRPSSTSSSSSSFLWL